ncbi:MAG: hypothetical protein ACXVNM_06355 [Bacteroidia bacterium]
MINKFILPLLAVLLLGSCANKFSLVKRKYNKGYYLDMSRNNSQKKHDAEKALVLKTRPVKSVAQINEPAASDIRVSEMKPFELQNEVAASPVTKKNTVTKEIKPLTASADKVIAITPSIKPLTLKALDFKSGKASSDSNLIILVILCFLWWLNLIAVYIHDGKKITLNFWITLLLDFTFIGGVIFSLLVVLDIVNLA